MEFVEGEDLRALLDRVRKLAPEAALSIFRQVCAGLEAAHLEDVMHRDLKPRNILIGRDQRVRIADFGLARSLEQSGLTRTGTIIGTPNYMAPEQAAGSGADIRSDIFSAGVVLYEMLTAELPFSGRSIADAFLSRTRDSARPIAVVDRSIPAWLARIVMRCLDKDPSKRFQSAREVLEALNQTDQPPRQSRQANGVISPGTMLGSRYRVEAFAGEGGMGKVYRAADLELNRTVAVKIIHPERSGDPQYMQMLRREISLASEISHRNVLRVHDLAEADGVRFVTMAWAAGEDLAHYIHRSRTIEESIAIRIGVEITEGAAAAHAKGVIHRDLKPSNILLDSDGHACIADFGIAAAAKPDSGRPEAGELVGTPRYMSPEQAERKGADARTDVYAIGLILYEMVTGRIPFADDSAFQTLGLRLSQPAPNPKLLNSAISDGLSKIVLRCLERDPEKRYQTADDLLNHLRRLEAGSRERAQPRPSWRLAAIPAALIVIAGVAVWFFAFRRSGASAPPQTGGKYIAVLPFRSLSDDPSVKYYAEGMTEAIDARLFSVQGAHPVSAAALERISLKQPEKLVARQLGANLIANGTVQAEGDRLQIFITVDDPTGNRLVWNGTYSGTRHDLFALEDQVATGLVKALGIASSDNNQGRQPLSDTQNLPAYDLYLRGRDILRTQKTVAGALEALNDFQQAISADRDFALAWTGVADSSLLLYRITKKSSWADKAVLAAREAKERKDSAEASFALGSVYSARGRYAEAVGEIKHALELAPNSDDGYVRLARAYLAMGQSNPAIAAAKKAVEINPFYWYNHKQLGFVYQQLGLVSDALPEFKKQVELDPGDATGYTNIGAIYYLLGSVKQSIPFFEKAVQIRPSYDAYSNLGTLYYQMREFPQAISMAEKAVELDANSSAALLNLAQIYAAAGRKADATATFDRGIAAAYRVLQVNPRNADELGTLAMCFEGEGDLTKARQMLARARSIRPDDRDLLYDQAVIEARAHRIPEALAALKKALQNGTSLQQALADPALAEVRASPQFADLGFTPKK
jgi:serine/threonine-protein kinase